ncbi:sensor histidine kinase [Methanobacterium formicicum]|uniref:Signal transduction histidine kinase n=1 Tax=Methanobacterium formicicum (strain DSM 3637 / PP1) TaxID=1204725 RepID=K2QD70_METFP|nr:histidine kinase dimerization/phosphoacceptor domain -containing protein [Methanobacterium formicicum]EKF85966.1 signal transduction histidine kinase [Methanobacterium formicicum DSM 3637]
MDISNKSRKSNKSREQLLAELKASYEEISTLKEDNQKLKTDKQNILKTNQNLLNVNQNLQNDNQRDDSCQDRFISQTALDFLELPLNQDIYHFIAGKIGHLIDEGFVIIFIYHPDLDIFKIKSMAGDPLKIKILMDTLPEEDWYNFNIQWNAFSPTSRKMRAKNQLYLLDVGFFEIMGGQLPQEDCRNLEENLDIGHIYVIGFGWDDKLYGSAVIFSSNEKPLENCSSIQTLVNLAAVALKNRTAEEALRANEEKFHKLFDNANDAIFLHKLTEDGISGKFVEVNSVTSQILGYTHEELLEMSPRDIEDIESFAGSEYMDNLLKNDKITFETSLISKDNLKIPVEISTHIFTLNRDKLSLSIARDITERKKMEEQLQVSLEEKEMLLREIHHRVKNNLMIISSLLNLESRYIEDQEVLNVFKDTQNRARSMALIHDRLYQSSHFKSINIGDYISTLAADLFKTYTADSDLVTLNLNVDDVMLILTP